MKTIIFVLTFLISLNVLAATDCKYILNQEAYWEDASGRLIVGPKTYRCRTMYFGQSGDMITACNKRKEIHKLEKFDFIVDFDGAEANFSVSADLDRTKVVCSGLASQKSSNK